MSSPPPSHVPIGEPGRFLPDGECRPHPSLFTNYLITACLAFPALPVLLPVLYFKYHTLRYRFDAEGVTMRVGILFRREVALTYRRIQDIHVTRGIIQRWLGLATVSCQTASGSSTPELVIEGLLDYETIRDFLYSKMRGARGEAASSADRPGVIAQGTHHDAGSAGRDDVESGVTDEALVLLTEIRDRIGVLTREVQALRASSGAARNRSDESGREGTHG